MISVLQRRLAKLADNHGMWARDVALNSELLATVGLEIEDVASVDAHHADEHNKNMLRKLARVHAAELC